MNNTSFRFVTNIISKIGSSQASRISWHAMYQPKIRIKKDVVVIHKAHNSHQYK
jgi:cyclic lactone autoinducer peptide